MLKEKAKKSVSGHSSLFWCKIKLDIYSSLNYVHDNTTMP